MNSLTKEDIQKIYQFVKSRGIELIDIQHEIVDHIASAIEHKRKEEPNKPMEQLIREVHQSFGVLGFSKISDAYISRIQKEQLRSFGTTLLSYFSTSKIVFPLLAALLAWQLTAFSSQFMAMACFIWLIIPFIIYFVEYFLNRKPKKYYTKYLVSSHAGSFILYLGNALNFYSLFFLNLGSSEEAVEMNPWLVVLFLTLHTTISLTVINLARQGKNKAKKLHQLYMVE